MKPNGHIAKSQVAGPEEAKRFLDENPGVDFVEVLFTPLSGVTRGKRLRRQELMAVFETGRFLPGSILVGDVTGQDCEATGLVWEDGDADRIGKPIPNTLVRAPWLGDDVAQVSLSLYELDGQPNDLDPRHVLRGVIDRFTADGLVPVVACELEFYLLDAKRGPNGEMLLASSPVTGRTPQHHQVYGLSELEEVAPFLRDLWTIADVQGIPLEGAISEYAPSQLELTLKHKPDALRAADDAVMYKRAVKGAALKHHHEATFMAKPFADRAGSGFHLHISINNEAGENLCADNALEGSPLLRHAIGGMKALLGESFALFAPNANSYRRFKANSYAPTTPTWGVNNRTVSLRVPAGPPSSRHVEHRVAGADANPYLAVAALLAGAHYGISNKIDPGPPVVGDGYSSTPAQNGGALPSNWFAAVEAFERSDVLKDYLGERFVKTFATVKRTEQARFFEVVTELDYDWYLRTA